MRILINQDILWPVRAGDLHRSQPELDVHSDNGAYSNFGVRNVLGLCNTMPCV